LTKATGLLGWYLGGEKATHGAVMGLAGDAMMIGMGMMSASDSKTVMM